MSTIKETAEKVSESIPAEEALTDAQERTISALGLMGTAATVITMTGTVLDISKNVRNNREAKQMKKEQENTIKEKNKRIKKKNRKRFITHKSPIATNGVVQDMFNQATGHTRYGASKLPGL